MSPVRKVGVEEELLLVRPDTGELANAAEAVLHEHRSERGAPRRPGPPATSRASCCDTWSARRQRQAFERTGDLRGLVADVVARTAESSSA